MNVAFLIFNRPELTRRVFESIREKQPDRLFVVADGPRPGQPDDVVRVAAARRVTEAVDWPCEVFRQYADTNMGCRRRVSSGLDWVFSQVEEATILEDDCLPHPDFFPFCEELLSRYRDNPRVVHVCGTSMEERERVEGPSYGFSRYTLIWGWATWRRAWKSYDVDMKEWPEVRASGEHRSFFLSRAERRYFERCWDDVVANRLDTWDAQWGFAALRNGRVAVRPSVNMVSNVGFGVQGASRTTFTHAVGNRPTFPMPFPLVHPEGISVDEEGDKRVAAAFFRMIPGWKHKVGGTVLSRHWYGRMVRDLPAIGPLWGEWRKRRAAK
jgi:hypothetical protein